MVANDWLTEDWGDVDIAAKEPSEYIVVDSYGEEVERILAVSADAALANQVHAGTLYVKVGKQLVSDRDE